MVVNNIYQRDGLVALLVIVATLGSVAYYCWEAWPTTAGKRGLLPLGSVAYYYGDKYIIVSSPAFCKFNGETASYSE